MWRTNHSAGSECRRHDRAPVGDPTTATGLFTTIQLGAVRLIGGQTVQATQHDNGQTSPPSPQPEPVAPAPAKLGAVVFLSLLNRCADWVFIGGVIPGVTVDVNWQGQKIGTAVADDITVSVPIAFPAGAAPGQTVEAVQWYRSASGNVIAGPTVPSMPLGEPVSLRELPAVTVTPPHACDITLDVSGLVDGATVKVTVNHDAQDGYPFAGNAVPLQLPRPLVVGDTVAVTQHSGHCRTPGAQLVLIPVTKPTPPTPPTFGGPVCPGAAVLSVGGLKPGADVWVQVYRDPGSGLLVTEDLGHIRAWDTDCEFPLPSGWAERPSLVQTTGPMYIQVAEHDCMNPPVVVKVPVVPLDASDATPDLNPRPLECSRKAFATGLTPGAVVTVRSDLSPAPYSRPIFVKEAAMPLDLYYPLPAPPGKIWLEQTSCRADAESPHRDIEPDTGSPTPVIKTPVRVPHRGVWVNELLPGGRVYVSFNGVLHPGQDITAATMFIAIPDLAPDRPLSVVQTMCTNTSAPAETRVELGVMTAPHHVPSPITRGSTTTITVFANDADSGQPVNGQVTQYGSILGTTNVPFSINFKGTPNPGLVEAPNYEAQSLVWNLVDPPPPVTTPPHTPVVPPHGVPAMHLSVTNQNKNLLTITSVTWSLWKQEPPTCGRWTRAAGTMSGPGSWATASRSTTYPPWPSLVQG